MNTARDIVGIYNFYYNCDVFFSYPGRAYAAYNIGAYRGHNYSDGTKATYTFPYNNINLGMFYGTQPA